VRKTRLRKPKQLGPSVPEWRTVNKALEVIHAEDHPVLFDLVHEPETLDAAKKEVRLGSQLRNVEAAVSHVLALRFVNLYWDNQRSSFGIAPLMDYLKGMFELAAAGKLPNGNYSARNPAPFRRPSICGHVAQSRATSWSSTRRRTRCGRCRRCS